MIKHIILDMLPFTVFVALLIFAFGLCMFVLHSTHPNDVEGSFGTLQEALFTTVSYSVCSICQWRQSNRVFAFCTTASSFFSLQYLLGLFGSADSTIEHLDHSASPMLSTFVLMALQVVVSIVFLNALIAIMGDTFERMQDSRELSMQMNRCQLAVEFVLKTLDEDEIGAMQRSFRWLHLLQPRSIVDSNGNSDEWGGRIKVISQLVQNVDDKVDSTQKQIGEVEKRIGENHAAVEKRIGENHAAVEKRIGENHAAVEKRIAELQEVLLARLPQLNSDASAASPVPTASVVAVPKPESD